MEYIDAMKGFAILCVVIGHIPDVYIARGLVVGRIAKALLDIMNGIYAFHMPLFMMISGYVYVMAYFDHSKRAQRERIKWQIGNMIVVYVLFSIGYGAFKMLFGSYVVSEITWKDILLIWAKPIYVYWYLNQIAALRR